MRSPSTSTVEDFSSALFPAGRSGRFSESTWLVGGLRMGQDFAHDPVMVDEVVALLGPVPPGVVIDGTVGGGGHAAAILDAHPHLSLLGLDRDPDALEAASDRLARFGARATLRRARFSALGHVAAEALPAGTVIAGSLLDLGVSSPQLDRAERGFSYRQDGPLDMRMDPTAGPSALDLVNEARADDLASLFRDSGERRLAHRLARAIVSGRPISTTSQLADVVSAAVPAALRRRGHPARRVFQALRIAVNEELNELSAALEPATGLLGVGGRCVVIAYHSGEDRIVKAAFANAVTGGCTCPVGLPCVCGAVPEHRLVFGGARKASADEAARNHRADSARLRALERFAVAS
jgi:16S rRNA (cytosine1402-N4)-methyltransferase